MPTDMVVLVPTRGRPESAKRLEKAFELTVQGATSLTFVVDSSDPVRNEYFKIVDKAQILEISMPGPPGIVHPLNRAANLSLMFLNSPKYLGFMGDDHLPQTRGWDVQIMANLNQDFPSFAYGNDLFQREKLPTACFMSSVVVDELGYMAPPELKHLYVDNFWKDLGEALGAITYLDDVIIEHLHFANGKSPHDETYEHANAHNEADKAAYEEYLKNSFEFDVELLKRYRP